MNPNSLNKYALVTGGNKGIGFAICQGLLKAGFKVILAARSLDKAKEAILKLQSNQVSPLIMGGDSATRSPEQGADTAIWLATEASPDLRGKVFRDRKEISY